MSGDRFTVGAPPPIAGAPDATELMKAALAEFHAGNYERSAGIAEEATRLAPSYAEAWAVLCGSLTKMGSVDADRAMADALEHISPDHPLRLALEVDRTRVLAIRGAAAEAAAVLLRIENDPALTARQHDQVGSVFAMIALYDKALPHCRLAVERMPDNPIAHYNLATALQYLGKTAEAEAMLEATLALDPDHSLAHASLAALRKWKPASNHIARLRAALARAPVGKETAARLNHALFKELNDVGERDAAWAALQEGSAILARLHPFDAAERVARTDVLIETFSRERLAHSPSRPPPQPAPIFVYGLPRSGTTLTERILAAHSRVTPMGETPGVWRALCTAAGAPRAKDINNRLIARIGEADPSEVARLYLENTAHLNTGADVITEKLPHNYEWVGAIHRAFPDAPLVHVRRSPMDSLFGAYRLQFGEGAYLWSYTFEDLAANYRQYRRLMDHWLAALGDRITTVTLEALIDDPEAEIRRLLASCGLAFEEACLSPHEADGGVSTASAAQVRSPINRDGVGAWRKYAREFEPLRAMLERDGFVDADGEPIWR